MDGEETFAVCVGWLGVQFSMLIGRHIRHSHGNVKELSWLHVLDEERAVDSR